MFSCVRIHQYVYIYIFTFMNRYETSHVHRLLIKGTIKCLEVISISILKSVQRLTPDFYSNTDKPRQK